jgi:hypothetical protein
MSHTLRIDVADDEPDMQEYYRRIPPGLGHIVVAMAEPEPAEVTPRR